MVVSKALPSGVLPEQVDPYTGAPLSVSPLTWSHAGFLDAVQRYARKAEAMDEAARTRFARAGELVR